MFVRSFCIIPASPGVTGVPRPFFTGTLHSMTGHQRPASSVLLIVQNLHLKIRTIRKGFCLHISFTCWSLGYHADCHQA